MKNRIILSFPRGGGTSNKKKNEVPHYWERIFLTNIRLLKI